MKFSQRVQKLEPSATLQLNAKVKELQASGIEVINLTAGEPDFYILDSVKSAAIQAVKDNHSRYTPAPGTPDLRDKVAEKTNRQQPSLTSPWEGKNVVVTNGAKQALVNALMALVDDGDQVLIPTPYWVSYPEMVKIAGGEPQFVSASKENGFRLTADDLKTALDRLSNVKVLLLNSPSNPTGAVYSAEELQSLATVLETHPAAKDLVVLSDEIYDRISLGDRSFCSFLSANPSWQSRTVTINGLSKSAAMTGWRVGWTVADEKMTQMMSKLQGQMTSGINSIAQQAAVVALAEPESAFSSQLEQYRKRRDLVLEILGKTGKMNVVPPDGAFYAFVEVKGKNRNGEKWDLFDFCSDLLDQKKVAVVPGTPFGQPDHFRLSFATDDEKIRAGCQRILEFIEEE